MDYSEYKLLVKKYFLLTCGFYLIFALIFVITFYTIDPLQFFHRSKVQNSPLSSNMRAQAAGILNTFDIDSIILGTSMLANTSASEASAKLGGKFFNISILGGSYYERAFLLKKALQKNLKNVIYSLDSNFGDWETTGRNIPKYLYDAARQMILNIMPH